jgi:hypothetical protein
MFRASTVTLTAFSWLLIVGLGGASLWSLLVMLRRARALSPVSAAALLLLRGALLGLVALSVISPARVIVQSEPQPTPLVLLVDTSASMALRDEGQHTRLDRALAAATGLESTLGPQARCAVYAFDAETQRVARPDGLKATGQQTLLWEALRSLRSAPAAALVVFTDGRDTSGETVPGQAVSTAPARLRAPVFCVGLGQATPPPDVRLERLLAPPVATAREPLSVAAEVTGPGFAGRETRVTLRAEGRAVAARNVRLASGATRAALSFTPEQPGVVKLTAEAAPLPGEHTTTNNQRHAFVRVKPAAARLVYLERGPDRDYPFLRRLLLSLEHMEVTLLLRKAPGGPWWRDWPLPLQQHSAPATADLRRADGILIGNLEPGDLPADAWQAVTSGVLDRGAGLLLLAGDRSQTLTRSGGPLKGTAPVDLSRLADRPVHLAAGKAQQPLAAELAPPAGQSWDDLPFLPSLVLTARTAPAGSVLLGSTEGAPVLVIQRAGAGRSAALLARGWYRWQLSEHATEASRQAYQRLFAGLARWLVQRTNDRPVRAVLSRDVCAQGEIARLTVEVSDDTFEPVPDARVTVKITGPGGEQPLTLTPVGGAPGRYEGAFAPGQAGTFKLGVVAQREGKTLGQDELRLVVEPRSVEQERPEQNVALLRELARSTGGRYFRPNEMAPLAAALPRGSTVSSHWTVREPWRTGWILAALIALAGLDWGLRRRWNVE